MSRAAFAEVYDLRDAVNAAFSRFVDRQNEGELSALLALARNAKGKYRRRAAFARLDQGTTDSRYAAARSVATDAFGAQAVDAIVVPARALLDEAYGRLLELRKSFDAALDVLAQDAEVAPGDPLCVDAVWTASYSSQGFGASRYARGAADDLASGYRALGVPVEVRRVVHGSSVESWEVWANVASMVDREIVRRRKVSLRDWMRDCLRRGQNPRVYNPFLPHGLEHKLGLDYYGNDLPAATGEGREVRA